MRQFVKFAVVGVSNTIISYLIYLVFLRQMQRYRLFLRTDYLICSLIAFLISVLWSFYWNSRFTFKQEAKEERNIWKALLKTYVSYSITGLFLNNVVLYVFVSKLGISKDMAPILSLLFTMPSNFILNKFWAFR